MMPRKPRAEFYNALGLAKQGKTLFYRDFLYHLQALSDKLSHRARHQGHGDAGVRPAVLSLSCSSSSRTTIRSQKDTTREQIKAKYLLVKQHDRVGRMADTLGVQPGGLSA